MTRLAKNLISVFRKPARVRPAPTGRRRTALRLESLEQRSMLTAMAPIGEPSPDLMPAVGDTELSAEVAINGGGTVADDVIVDGRIITGENFDAASAGEPHIVRKMTGRTSYQPASASPYGSSAGRDVLLGGLGDDFLLSRATAGGHAGAVNVLLGDGSVNFIRHSGAVIVALGDGSVRFISDSIDTVLASDLQDDTDTDAAAGSNHSEWKYVPVRRTASSTSGDTSVDFDGRQITYTGLERAATDAELASFFAFDSGFRGGVNVATGDVNGDGRDDIIIGAGPGAPGGHVKVIDANRLGDLGNDWLVGGTGRDDLDTVGDRLTTLLAQARLGASPT